MCDYEPTLLGHYWTLGPPIIWPIAINDVTRSASDDDIGPSNLDWVKRVAISRGKSLGWVRDIA
jgi:hypothetical protein